MLTACHITAALQSIVSRNLSPRDPAVVSVTKVVGGEAYNVIPETATISGTASATLMGLRMTRASSPMCLTTARSRCPRAARSRCR